MESPADQMPKRRNTMPGFTWASRSKSDMFRKKPPSQAWYERIDTNFICSDMKHHEIHTQLIPPPSVRYHLHLHIAIKFQTLLFVILLVCYVMDFKHSKQTISMKDIKLPNNRSYQCAVSNSPRGNISALSQLVKLQVENGTDMDNDTRIDGTAMDNGTC